MRISISDPSYGNLGEGSDDDLATNAEAQQRYARHQISEQIEDIITINEITREQLAKRFGTKGRTTIDDDCGYLDTSEISIEMLYELYKRDPLAKRICEIWAEESWRKFPTITDTAKNDEESEFDKAFEQLCRDLSGDSWSDKETATNEFWNVASNADALSSIGNYSAIVIGLDDGKPLSEPIEGFEDADEGESSQGRMEGPKRFVSNAEKDEKGKTKLRHINYLQSYSQRHCRVASWEQRPGHSRLGLPTSYEIRNDDDIGVDELVQGMNRTYRVHWSRVVHICPNAVESKVLADSQLLVVYNRLWDAVKVYAGSAEGFWQGSIPGISLEPSGSDSVRLKPEEVADARKALDDYISGVKRFLLSNSLSAKTLAPTVVAPTAHIDGLIDVICIVIGVPVRIFKGSERGELASSQDESAHDGRCEARREKKLSPLVIAPLVNRLIAIRALPEPKDGGWSADWPSLREKTPLERAELVGKIIEALQKYIAGGVAEIISPEDLLTRKEFLGLPKDVVAEVLEKAAKLADDAEQDAAKKEEDAMKAQAALAPPIVPGQPAPAPGVVPPGKPKQPPGLPAPPKKTDPNAKDAQPTATPGGKATTAQPNASKGSGGITKPKPPTKPLGANHRSHNQKSHGKGSGGNKFHPTNAKNRNAKAEELKANRSKKAEEAKHPKDKKTKGVAGVSSSFETKSNFPKYEDVEFDVDLDEDDFNMLKGIDDTINSPEVLSNITIPDTVYHITDRSNLNNIQEKGLTVGEATGSSSASLILGSYTATKLSDFDDESFGDILLDDPVLLEVKTKGLKFRLDPEYGYNVDTANPKQYAKALESGKEMKVLYTPKGIPAASISVSKTSINFFGKKTNQS